MEQRLLGSTGVSVSSLCLGTMMLGSWGEPDHDTAIRIVHAALDAGITVVDTADIYSHGESEEIVGKALAGRRDDVVLATKVTSPMGPGPNHRGGSRRWILRACEDSLRRLRTDHLDIYQLHRPDPTTSVEETLIALDTLVTQGKVRYVGTSTFPASQLVEAQWAATRFPRARPVCEQPPYSLLARGVEADVLPTCRRHDIGVLPWSPLGGGWLSGRWHRDATELVSRRTTTIPNPVTRAHYDLDVPANRAKLDAATALAGLADEAGLTLIDLALAFVLRHPAVSSVVVGPRTPAHLQSQLGAPDVVLDDDLLERVDAIVAPGVDLNPDDTGYVASARTGPQPRSAR